MQVAAIYNFKGGSFKTTATHTLATGLAARGKKVLVIDTDPQAHATKVLGLQMEPGLYDFLARQASIQKVLRVAPAQQYTQEDSGGMVAVIPGNDETALIPMKMNDPMLLQKRLAKLADYFDYALIDTSPTPSLLSSAIYLASDAVIYPTKCEALHLDGLVRAIQVRDATNVLRGNAQLAPIKDLGVIPAIFRPNTLEHTEHLNLLKQNFEQSVWSVVPDRIIWAEASRMMQPVFAYAPESKAAKDALRLVAEFERRMVVS